ncbi:MAG: hypothetical protein NT096_09975 [Proteobacteria bacterium]|jgi:uncharacterized alpha-E superfamily protein|nr:hypothetical protein [Pseudomonadota bacterium]
MEKLLSAWVLMEAFCLYGFVVSHEDHWGDSIIKCYEAAGELIKEYRQQRGDDFWNNLDRLYKRTKKRRNSNSNRG